MTNSAPSRFREFDFTHGAFVSANPHKQEFLRRAYKSKMTASEFIEKARDLRQYSTSTKSKARSKYWNDHVMDEWYRRLDDKYNFFGHYDQ